MQRVQEQSIRDNRLLISDRNGISFREPRPIRRLGERVTLFVFKNIIVCFKICTDWTREKILRSAIFSAVWIWYIVLVCLLLNFRYTMNEYGEKIDEVENLTDNEITIMIDNYLSEWMIIHNISTNGECEIVFNFGN